MAKLVLNNITSGFASTTALNKAFDDIEAAIENTVSRNGVSPNSMTADLDMNGKNILNTGDMLIGGVGLAASVTAASASAATAVAAKDIAVTSKDTAVSSASSATASAAIVADWDYRGAWATATEYLKNNIVYESDNGASYIALSNHTSGTFSTDLGAAKWGLLALRGSAGTGTGDMLKSENLSGLANNTTARSNLGAQTLDATLTALAGLATGADKLPYSTGTDTFAETPLTAFARTLLDDADAATARATLGVVAASDTASGIVELATSAEAAAGTDTVRAITPAGLKGGLNATGTAPVYACRAWVNFNGTGVVAIRASGNVSSIADNGVGDYTVNFGTALPDASYSVMGSCRGQNDTDVNSTLVGVGVLSTTAASVYSKNAGNTLVDSSAINVAVFR